MTHSGIVYIIFDLLLAMAIITLKMPGNARNVGLKLKSIKSGAAPPIVFLEGWFFYAHLNLVTNLLCLDLAV